MKRYFNPYFLVGITILLAAGIPLSHALFMPHEIPVSKPIFLKIKKGDSLSSITEQLYQSKLIRSKFLFKWVAVVSGNSKNFKIGQYRIEKKMSILELIRLLKRGSSILLEVTTPEGMRMTDIFSLLKKTGFRNEGLYWEAATDQKFVQSLGLPTNVTYLEGFLYPETYKFAETVSEKRIIKTMVDTFFTIIPKDYAAQARKVGLSLYKAVILASIIEKETGARDERRLISSVFHNRLNRNMRLQTDPTVIYGTKNFDGNLTRKQLRTPSRYNTYLNYGLPPTPIANPGLESLMAAVQPSETEFLYFVAMGNGRHKFSTDYQSHLNAVKQFQKRRRKNYRSF